MPHPHGGRQRVLQKLIRPFENRIVSAAAESRPLFVTKTEGNEGRLLKLERVGFLAGVSELRKLFVHTDDFQGLIPKIMGLLRVQREDLERDGSLGNNERNDALCAERPHCR